MVGYVMSVLRENELEALVVICTPATEPETDFKPENT